MANKYHTLVQANVGTNDDGTLVLTVQRHEGGDNTSSMSVTLTPPQAIAIAMRLLRAIDTDESSWWVTGDK